MSSDITSVSKRARQDIALGFIAGVGAMGILAISLILLFAALGAR